MSEICARFVAHVVAVIFKKFMKTVLFPNKNLLKSHGRRIFVFSASLLKEREVVLNAIFDFTYRELKNRLWQLFSKWDLTKKKVLDK